MAARSRLHLIAVLLCLASPCAAQITLSGRVVDGEDAPVRDAHVSLRQTASTPPAFETQTDPTGAFTLSVPAAGDYLLSVDREGFYALRDRPIQVGASPSELTVTINSIREAFQSVDVNEETSAAEPSAVKRELELSGTEINAIPYANSHSFPGSLQLLPEIVPDATGAPHVNGASTNQVLYLLNGFNLTNPISGQFQTALPVEGIRSVDLSSGRYSPEYGKGSAGVLAINTASGADTFHYTATDFIPGLSTQQSLHLGNWYPRVGISGPILRHKAWFSDMAGLEYTQAIVTGLPANADTRSGWLVSNIFHAQFNLTSSNILFTDFLINNDNEGRVGLGPLNPVSTTLTVHSSQYFGSVKDQISFTRGALIEFGYAHGDYSLNQTPQGTALYVFSPEGNSGNNFSNSRQSAARDEGMLHAYLPPLHWLGEHRMEAGADTDRTRYDAAFSRTGYDVIGLSGQLISQTLYGPPASFGVGDVDESLWFLDTWHPAKRLEFTPGIRQDWDQLIGRSAWSPRLGFSWSPLHSDRATLSGGYAITRDTVTLDLFGFPLDQISTTTTPSAPPRETTFTTNGIDLQMPRAQNWNLDLNYRLSSRISLAAKYLRRRGTDELIYANSGDPYAPPSLLPLPGGAAAGNFALTNLRRDDFDSVQFSIHQKLAGQYEWMATYTHSSAVSNALLDVSASEPVHVLPYLAPVPWNAPNRITSWAWLPLPVRNWSLAILANLRSGFPYSVRDQTGLVEGLVGAFRYPVNFDLNLAIERMITLRGYRFALRGGVDNLTDRLNPTAVNNVAGAPGFGEFLGDEGRHFVVRIRFFGRAGAAAARPSH